MPGQDAKYQQVIDWVKQNIADGSFREGDKLMSENEMSALFGLSRQTIRRATGELVSQHLVTRVQGSGTYIGSRPEEGMQTGTGENSDASMNIAVISTFTESYIFPGILKGISKVLTDNGYTTQVFFTDNRLSREEAVLKMILEKDSIDGLIVEPVKSALPNPNLPYYRKLQEHGIPILFFNAFYPGLDAPCVRIDDKAAAVTATRLLLDAGHEKIGAIFKGDDGQGPLRYEGYLQAMREAGCKTKQNTVLWLDTPAAYGMKQFVPYLFERLDGCTGVVCYNDQIAHQLINLALEQGKQIPEDLSVVGIDDSYLADVCKVPFASVSHPKEELGKQVAENMVQMIRDPSFDGNTLMESRAVLRDSIRRIC